MYQWIVFLHILSAFVFFTAHGASAAMAFRLRHEHELARIRAILDLSDALLPAAYFALLVVVLAGIAAGIMAGWFRMGWIWAALVLLVVLWVGMHAYAFRFYTPLRKAVGLPWRDGKDHPAEPPASDSEIAALIQKANPLLLALPSLGVIAIILWLMMFKPF
ncbi:MAG: hypothetical protein GC204_07575 [Chloroflexi bacterium]|nr:hypothetical protein [Chloroflexota bacterium]